MEKELEERDRENEKKSVCLVRETGSQSVESSNTTDALTPRPRAPFFRFFFFFKRKRGEKRKEDKKEKEINRRGDVCMMGVFLPGLK